VGRAGATLISLVCGLPVYDTQCGAKIFRNAERLRQVFRTPFRVYWTFDVEILARFLLLDKISADREPGIGLSSILLSDGKISPGRNSRGGIFSVVPGRF
jgi:hypothetical protein